MEESHGFDLRDGDAKREEDVFFLITQNIDLLYACTFTIRHAAGVVTEKKRKENYQNPKSVHTISPHITVYIFLAYFLVIVWCWWIIGRGCTIILCLVIR